MYFEYLLDVGSESPKKEAAELALGGLFISGFNVRSEYAKDGGNLRNEQGVAVRVLDAAHHVGDDFDGEEHEGDEDDHEDDVFQKLFLIVVHKTSGKWWIQNLYAYKISAIV